MAKRGRPTKYDHEYAEKAYKLCLLGATDAEMADILGVAESTLNKWKDEHTEFSESIARGKAIADANVAERLYERACGYSHDEEKLFQYEGQVVRAETRKHYPPDTQAISLWLRNRSTRWRDKHDHEVTGKDGAPLFQVPEDRQKQIDDDIERRREQYASGNRNGTT